MKKWYESKTLWFNFLALIATVAANWGYTGELPGNWQLFVPVIIIAINMILRWLTGRPISL